MISEVPRILTFTGSSFLLHSSSEIELHFAGASIYN
jgi:hypothetical protein